MVAATTVAAVGGGAALLYSAYSLFWWYEGEKCEKPKYEVKQVLVHSSQKFRLRKFDEVEVREYAPYIIAEATIHNQPMRRAAGKGFMQVARFIFGANTKKDDAEQAEKVSMTSPVRMSVPAADAASEKIPMTAPVQVELEGTSPEAQAFGEDASSDQTYRVSFVMPSKYDMATLPVPKDTSLSIQEVPAHCVAVHTTFGATPSKEGIQEIAAKLRGHVEAAGLEVEGDTMLYSYHPPFAPAFLRRVEIVYNLKASA